jgi:hypothetical protein
MVLIGGRPDQPWAWKGLIPEKFESKSKFPATAWSLGGMVVCRDLDLSVPPEDRLYQFSKVIAKNVRLFHYVNCFTG